MQTRGTGRAHLLGSMVDVAVLPQLALVGLQEGLLRPDDGAWAAHADVRDGLLGGEVVVLHQVAAYQHTGAPQSRLHPPQHA